MAVFLAVFDNQYAKEKQEMLDTTFYKQVTDSKITDAIQTATDEAKKDGGFYRTVQLGTDDENAANLNRVWNTDQYISCLLYTSANFSKNLVKKMNFRCRNMIRKAKRKNSDRIKVRPEFLFSHKKDN